MGVAAGAVAGGAARLATDALLPHELTEIPWSTLLINAVGSLLLGLLVSGPWTARLPDWLATGLTAGLLGTFTTLSAVGVATVALLDAGLLAEAGVTVAFSLVVGLAAAWLGLAAGSAWSGRDRGPAR